MLVGCARYGRCWLMGTLGAEGGEVGAQQARFHSGNPALRSGDGLSLSAPFVYGDEDG